MRTNTFQFNLPPTAKRVAQNTPAHINHRIRQQTERNIAYFEKHPDRINQRLDELDREWDIERAIETVSSGLSLAGLTLAATTSRKWLILPIVVQSFLMQHALQGWCPPIPVLRRLGFRTAREIDKERHALLEIYRPSENRIDERTQVKNGDAQSDHAQCLTKNYSAERSAVAR